MDSSQSPRRAFHDEALTDDELVERAKEGSEAHFNALVDRYAPLVYRLAMAITGDAQEAEDIVQETFVKVFTNLERFSREKAGFRTWVLAITRNHSINVFRALRRKAARFLAEFTGGGPDSGLEQVFSDQAQTDQETRMLVKEEFLRLNEALKKLPERQRSALMLKATEGLSYDEIAVVLGTSGSAVESLIFRARRTLLDELGE